MLAHLRMVFSFKQIQCLKLLLFDLLMGPSLVFLIGLMKKINLFFNLIISGGGVMCVCLREREWSLAEQVKVFFDK